ncbi:MAG TPA: methionine adenosyltransferase [Flavobacteriales bacterium]|nr:methionine adenosyltransferase [Flavobacteriales bacterium]HIO59686.1 methionine adenosyltransferase [Flavobacteriales bacterium]
MSHFFTSESVSEGHPDKVADAISDALIDHFLAFDSNSKVACETMVTSGQVILAGEVNSNAYIDVQKIARDTIRKIGYTKSEYKFDAESCGVLSAIHEQSDDINQGVVRSSPEEQGAGDQGMMFGYASRETDNYMPLPLDLSHRLLFELAQIRKAGKEMTYLRPDSKSQVTIQYSDSGVPERIEAIVVSTQHDDGFEASDELILAKIKKDVAEILIPRVKAQMSDRVQSLFTGDHVLHVNPTGKFVIGGPHGDSGLTGRKIIVDTYGGKGAHGGGAFSGKDPSKVDRSAAYATRHIAKNLVAAGVCDEVLVQVAYAIGVANPVGLYVDTYGTSNVDFNDGEIAKEIANLFSMKPYDIEQRFNLRTPIYSETSSYGHMGRQPKTVMKSFEAFKGGDKVDIEVELFPWEKLDMVNEVKSAFGLS